MFEALLSNRTVSVLVEALPRILTAGLTMTIPLTLVSFFFAMIIAVVVALVQYANVPVLRQIARFYIWVIRGTPLMLQILFIYYGLPFIIDGLKLPAFPAAIIAFVLNYAAYFAEIFRGGIQSIDRGQYEGAKVLGMTYVQTMRRIILPQVIKRVLPPVSNETINLLKDTSLVYILAMNDILRITRSIVQRDFDTTAFLVAAVFYLFFTFILTKVFGYLEKRYAVYDE